jgi:hypothetical protein
MPSELSCEDCVSSNNGGGFLVGTVAGSGATIRVSHSAAINNVTNGFIQLDTGVFESVGNNTARGNGTNKVGVITVVGPD